MSDKCGNCDCADKSSCTKGNSYGAVIVDTESRVERRSEEEFVAGENNGGCKCGTSCSCGADCKCGH